MRILHTVEFYHPNVGGAERVVQRVSEGLAARGHEVVVVTSEDPRRPSGRLNHVEVVSFRVTGNLARGLHGQVVEYQAWLRRQSFDVMLNYAAQVWPTDAALPLLRDVRAARVLAPCGFSGLHGLRRVVYWRYFRTLARRLRDYDAAVCHSANTPDARFCRRWGPVLQTVIPNGADGAEFDRAPAGFRRRHDVATRYMLLHVGNHYRVKGHDDLLRVFASLRAVDATLVIVGGRPPSGRSCWENCQRAAARDGRVRLLSGLPRSEVAAAYREADLVLLTSRFEAAPLTLVEAMAAGTPFVSYDVGNAAELAGGLVVRSNTAEEMARVVRGLLQDHDRRRGLGDQGRQVHRRMFEWEHIIGRYEEFYTTVCATVRSSRGMR